MSEPKPLTKERRHHFEVTGYSPGIQKVIDELLDAVDYWRESVMKVEPATCNDDECCFCGQAFGDSPSVSGPAHHAPDCPWLLANEQELDK